MKDHPIIFSAPMVRALLAGRKMQTRRLASSPLRKVQPGERLWVRENWCKRVDDWGQPHGTALYMADGQHVVRVDGDGFTVTTADGREASPWRPSIHMPRWASRLTLTVTEVRVQRLQDMDRGDAMEEGCPFSNMAAGPSPRDWFRDLWNSLHGADAWDANPEVVALTFTVAQRNIDAVLLEVANANPA